jgi:predicted metal-dependent hydrolase
MKPVTHIKARPIAPLETGRAGSPSRPLPDHQPPAINNQLAFKTQVASWAARIRVQPRQVRIQAMRHKWASCSTAGTVSFSTDLLTQPADFREYVIVHELLHLKIPNHGKLFKSLLRAYLPNHESIKPQYPHQKLWPTTA